MKGPENNLRQLDLTLQRCRTKRRSAPRAHAAVALVFRSGRSGLELLLIERATAEGDRWSGDVAFPGGKLDPDDADSLAAARRETREEVGLELEGKSVLLGRLPIAYTLKPKRPLPMAVQPFVFALVEGSDLAAGPEVEAAFWVPWGHLADRSNTRRRKMKIAGLNVSVESCEYEGRAIWGLTLHIIRDLRRRWVSK